MAAAAQRQRHNVKPEYWSSSRPNPEVISMCYHCMNRRQFNTLTAAGVAAGLLGSTSTTGAALPEIDPWDPDKPLLAIGRPLRVQPILAHAN